MYFGTRNSGNKDNGNRTENTYNAELVTSDCVHSKESRKEEINWYKENAGSMLSLKMQAKYI